MATVLVTIVGSEARAQGPVGAYTGASAQAGYPGSEPFGGFGFNHAQVLPSNSYVLDQWWMLWATPTVGTVAPEPAAPAPPATRPAPASRTPRNLVRRSTRASAPATHPLPTGSLYWPGASGVVLYSPAQRYASYEGGYARSAYGTIDYGLSYKGFYWGY
jgi:hypothetical protein